MFIKRKYAGVCSICKHDVFVDFYTWKLDLETSCSCINNEILPRKWVDTYVFGPMYYKAITFLLCLVFFNSRIAELVGLGAILFFWDWCQKRRERIQNKVHSVYRDGWKDDNDLTIELLEGYSYGTYNSSSTGYPQALGTRDNH